jgi:hypothetical protein
MNNTISPSEYFDASLQPERIQWIGILFCLCALGFILYLVSRKKIKESYSLVFICGCLIFLMLSIKRSLVDSIGFSVGIYYPPAALFFIISIVFFALFIHFSILLTKLSKEKKVLIQQLSILKYDFEDLKKKLDK